MRLIDGNALRRKMVDILLRYDTPETFGEKLAVYSAFDEVINCPTIDPERLRPKGRWVKIGADEYTCDKCHAIFECESVIRCGYNFCPNCGATMED